MMMVKAGQPVDDLIEQLLPHLSRATCSSTAATSTTRTPSGARSTSRARGCSIVGTGVSGGEEGALKGPSLMPGGSEKAWPLVKPIFQAIAAKVGPKNDIPCCEWVGPRGAGHYVKMVHNGIEYGDMQLICEAYLMLKEGGGLSNDELYDVFDEWNRGELQSYLIEITRDIFSVKDDQGGDGYLVDKILDVAGAKGTGKWMSQLALDLGVPSTMVTEAVYARGMSALKDARVRASKVLKGPTPATSGVNIRRPARRSSKPCGRPSTPRRSAATPRASCSCRPPPRSTTGRSTTATSPSSGAAAASSGRRSWSGSRKRSTRKPNLENLLLASVLHRGHRQGPSRLAAGRSSRPR